MPTGILAGWRGCGCVTERDITAGKPNYKFDRLQREQAKAEKKAARAEEKKKKAEERNAGDGAAPTDDDPEATPTGI